MTIAQVSLCHQHHGDCISSRLVPILADSCLRHLYPVSCPPSCYATSAYGKQLRGTNSEKPEPWVTSRGETSVLKAMKAHSRPILLGNKTQQWWLPLWAGANQSAPSSHRPRQWPYPKQWEERRCFVLKPLTIIISNNIILICGNASERLFRCNLHSRFPPFSATFKTVVPYGNAYYLYET